MTREDHDHPRDLGERLRRAAADALPAGPVPVEGAVRAGRRIRFRRRVTAGAVVAVGTAAAVGLGALLASGLSSSPAPPADGMRMRVVQPYEPVEIGDDLVLALLPEGARYVISSPESLEKNLEIAKDSPDVLPRLDAFATDLNVSHQEPNPVANGLWRTDAGIARIALDTGERLYDADLYKLPGEQDWAAFYVDTTDLDLPRVFAVNAYDADGDVIDSATFATADPGPDAPSAG